MTVNVLRTCLLTAAICSGAAVAQVKPISPVEPKPTDTREESQIQRTVERRLPAQVRLARGPFAGTMDCSGGGMDVKVQVLRKDGVEHYGVEMIFTGSITPGPGVCTVDGGFRPEGLSGGKARLSFVFPLAQLRALEVQDGRLEEISTHPRQAGRFIMAAIKGGWFRVNVREVSEVGAMPLYLVDEIVERRIR